MPFSCFWVVTRSHDENVVSQRIWYRPIGLMKYILQVTDGPIRASVYWEAFQQRV